MHAPWPTTSLPSSTIMQSIRMPPPPCSRASRSARATPRSARCWRSSSGSASCSLGYTEIALPAGAAALTGLFVAAVARGERGALVARLIGQRSAYQIPEVARAAERMACMGRRQELARALARLVFVAEGIEPARHGPGRHSRAHLARTRTTCWASRS